MIEMQITENGWVIIDVPGKVAQRLGITWSGRHHWALGMAMSALQRPTGITVLHIISKRGISNPGFRAYLRVTP